MEKLYKVQMNSKGMPDFSTAVEVADRPSAVDLSSVYSTAYKSGYEKGKADRPQDDEFKNFDRESLILLIEAQKERIGELLADRPQGEWLIEKTLYDNYNYRCSYCDWYETHAYPDVEPYNYCPNCGARMKGVENEYERAVEQMEYDMLYEPTYNPEDGSM